MLILAAVTRYPERQVALMMIDTACIALQASAQERPSVPPWFAEVVLIAHYLTQQGVLEALAHQVRLVRGRFGQYEVIDFLVLLLGYAISGERTLPEFFSRLAPFAMPFMALFGRSELPHRSSLSRFLAAVDRSCLEAFRTQFEKSFGQQGSEDAIGGVWDRQGQRHVGFDIDATRQPARQRALPRREELPAARRRLDQVCAPGYRGRKRGEVVRSRTTVLQMHSRQWGGTYSGAGNGDYREELRSACGAIHTYLDAYHLPHAAGLVRLDGQYGDGAVIAQVMKTGLPVVVRGRAYPLLNHPQIQQVLEHPPTSVITLADSGLVYELFDGGWLWVEDAQLRCRVVIARRAAPPPPQTVTVGKRVGDVVYELFFTTTEDDAFLVQDIVDLSQGRGAFEGVLADEDVEQEPDRWCSYTPYGQELWQIAAQWVWNVRWVLGSTLQTAPLRAIEWSPIPDTLPVTTPSLSAEQAREEEYGPFHWAGDAGRARGRLAASAFVLQGDGTLQCPAGASLWLQEQRQETPYAQRLVFCAPLEACQSCHLREQCLGRSAQGNRARRVSAVRRLLPLSRSPCEREGTLLVIRWVDVAGRSICRHWIRHWRTQAMEVVCLTQKPEKLSPPPRPPRAVRCHQRLSWKERLDRNAWWGPPRAH